jgi:hypothetical protein
VNLYVYYRVRADQAAACRAAVAALQAQLGVAPRLLRRADDPATWMEIYEDVDEAFAARLEEAAVRLGLPACLADGRRHLERFVPCA